MEVILIRHTAVDVSPGICYGQTDVPLRTSFAQEAAQTFSALRKSGKVDAAFTSPLSRAVRLAEYCGFMDAARDPRLMEIHFGEWEMRPFDQIRDARLEEWYQDFLNVAPTGGESFMDLLERVRAFLDELALRPLHRVAVFTHGGVILSARIACGQLTLDRHLFSHLTPYGGIERIQIPGTI